jgi:imidazole glycerol-phosphate synthase subunit HisH
MHSVSESKRVVIVDYGVGNLGSIVNMLKKAGAEGVTSADPEVVRRASRLILAGVGAFDTGIRNLRERGLVELLDDRVRAGVPVLGLCLGMQLLGHASEEGTLAGLGWINARARRFTFHDQPSLKVPHMGWNTVTTVSPHPLLQDLGDDARFYFVHSYYMSCADPSLEIGRSRYGFDFCSVVAAGNVLGVQFHPEKSHKFGMALLRNFIHFVPVAC